MRYNFVMPMDAKGYMPPILCMVRDCGDEAVIEDYVTNADGMVSPVPNSA